jgi:hypothetical protein
MVGIVLLDAKQVEDGKIDTISIVLNSISNDDFNDFFILTLLQLNVITLSL